MEEEFKEEELIDEISTEPLALEPEQQPKKIEVQEVNCADMDLVTVSPVEFSSFDELECSYSQNPKNNLDIVQDVKMHITVELGRAKCSVKKILDFNKGSIVELNKVAGEQVELYANGRFVAYGEVIVIEDKFGLRVTSIAPQNIQS